MARATFTPPVCRLSGKDSAMPARIGFRFEDDVLVVLVLAVDKREDMVAYRSALERLLAGK